MDFTVTFLGTSSAIPTADRGLSATLVQHRGTCLLVDCGEGTQRQLRRPSRPVDLTGQPRRGRGDRAGPVGITPVAGPEPTSPDEPDPGHDEPDPGHDEPDVERTRTPFMVDAVLLTHLHGDHYLGLIGLLKSYALLQRTAPLCLVGPRGLRYALDQLRVLVGPLAFQVVTQEVAAGVEPELPGCRLRVEPFATRHSVPSVGYRFSEPDRPGTFDVARARELGVPAGPLYRELQDGHDVEHEGRLIRSAEVVGPARAGRSLALTGDTEPCQGILDGAAGVDLLVHESTFVADQRERARTVQHSCADEAARAAADAGVRALALTHLSQTVTAAQVLAEARPVFDTCFVPDDLDRVSIDHPET